MQVTIRIPDEYDEKIKRLANAMGLKKSDIALLALITWATKNIWR